LFGGVGMVFCMLALILPVIGPELLRSKSPRARTMSAKLAPLLLLAGAAVLVALVMQFDLADIGQAWSTMGWAALATPLIALLWFGANTTGSHALFGGRVPWLTLLLIRLMGEGYNALMPKAGIAGEPIKVQHLTAYVTTDRARMGVVLDRLLNMLSGLVVSGLLVAASLVLFEWPPTVVAAAAAYIVLAAFGAFTLARALRRDPAGMGAWVLRRLGHSSTNNSSISNGAVLQAFVWHLFGRLAMALEIAFLLYLLDLDFGIASVVALTGLLSAAGAISFIIPQSLGVAEAAAALAFFLVGFPPVLGVAFGLVRRGRALFISMLGVGIHMLVGTETAALEDSQQVPSSGF
jgi:hypothetical protein